MNLAGTTFEGPLERKTNKWKEYYVVLRDGHLSFYKDKSSNTVLLGTLELSVTTFCNPSSAVLARGYQFSVTTPAIEANFRASTADLRDKWIREIMSAVTELTEQRRNITHGASVRYVPEHPPAESSQVYDSTLIVPVANPEHEWYWPGITRDQAEGLLKSADNNHFLVRDSGHEQGSYSLSVRVGAADNKLIFHYIIKRDHAINKFILVPAPDKRFDTLEQVIDFYLNLNRDHGLLPLRNPAYRPAASTATPAPHNFPAAAAMTHNPTTGPQAPTSAENEYVRLGKFPAKQDSQSSEDGSQSKAPVKPTRPNVARGGGTPQSSEYMNVTPAQPITQEVISGASTGGRDGNYIYAAVGGPKGSSPANGGPGPIIPGDSIVIRGAERTTPVVPRFGDMGAPVQFTRNGSSSMFEDSAPPSSPKDSSCYVNFELSNQVNNLGMNEERPKSSGMSKASAKVAKKNKAKANAQRSAATAYPPAPAGPVGYNDPCLSMTTPPSKGSRAQEEELFPAAAAGGASYNDPALSMTQPPAHNHRQQTVSEQFPAAGPGVMGYTDPALSMSQPSRMRGTGRHNV